MKILFKKILYTLVLSVGLISVSSCADYLDVSDEIADNLSLEDVFEREFGSPTGFICSNRIID